MPVKHKPVAVFRPLDWQIAPWRDKSPTILLTGAAGGGKSRLAGEKLHAYCLKYPGTTALMLRKTRESMTNSTVLFMERKVIGGQTGVRHFPSKNRFEYFNSSILAYGGMKNEEQREQIRGIGQDGSVDIVWIEEANRFTEDDLNEVLARVRGKAAPWQQVILATNPDAPSHWINKRLIQGGEASVYYSKALDNPYNPPGYLEALNRLTGILRKRLLEGKWVQAEGVVYEDWRPELHVIDPFEIPEDWRRIRSIDFGYTNPFVCHWWAIDGDGRMFLYREIYQTQRLVEDMAEEIKQLSKDEVIEQSVADHDAEDRATLERHGISTIPARKAVSPGLQAVGARLRKAGDGRPRLFVMRGCTVNEDVRLVEAHKPTSTEAEFEGYIWPKGRDGKPLKEQPVKENDHGMDATKYAVMHIDGGPRVSTEPNPFYD